MKFRVLLTILSILTSFWSLPAAANTEPMKFKAWKEKQIVEAQNEVLRISARLRTQKAAPKSEFAVAKDADINSSRFQQVPEATEKDLKSAQEALEIAKEFRIEDYAEVYVSNLQEDPEQFQRLINSLSKDEMTQLMKVLVKNKTPEKSREEPRDTKRYKLPTRSTLASSNPPS